MHDDGHEDPRDNHHKRALHGDVEHQVVAELEPVDVTEHVEPRLREQLDVRHAVNHADHNTADPHDTNVRHGRKHLCLKFRVDVEQGDDGNCKCEAYEPEHDDDDEVGDPCRDELVSEPLGSNTNLRRLHSFLSKHRFTPSQPANVAAVGFRNGNELPNDDRKRADGKEHADGRGDLVDKPEISDPDSRPRAPPRDAGPSQELNEPAHLLSSN